jgi:hypothetical protein
MLRLILPGLPTALCGLWLLSRPHLNLIEAGVCCIVAGLLVWVMRRA